MKTTVQISREVKEMLDELKLHIREPYDSVIRRLVETRIDYEPLSEGSLKRVEEALKEVKAGKVYVTEDVKRELDIG